MHSEKCKSGGIDATKIPRFSGCLVAIGYTLLITSILGILITTFMAVAGTSATGTAAVEGVEQAKARAVEQLREIPVVGTALGGTMAAGIGSAMVLVVYFISIPALVLGFVLLLKRKVWKCNSCGSFFERA